MGWQCMLLSANARSKTAPTRSLCFQLGDILDAWRSWRLANVIFCSSLCFPDSVMERLGEQLDDCPRLRWVASLKMLPKYSTFTLAAVERWPMTWHRGDGCPVYLYKRLPCYPLTRSLLEEPWATLASTARARESDEGT